MAIRRVRPSKVLVGTQFSRRDFLKISGTGLAGCGPARHGGLRHVFERRGRPVAAGGGDTLNLNLAAEIPDLDSALATDKVSFDILVNMMEGLLQARLRPEARTGRRRGRGGQQGELTYTFTLRDGIRVVQRRPRDFPRLQVRLAQGARPRDGERVPYIIYTFVRGAAEYNAGGGQLGGRRHRDAGRQDAARHAREQVAILPAAHILRHSTSPSSRSTSSNRATTTPRTRTP